MYIYIYKINFLPSLLGLHFLTGIFTLRPEMKMNLDTNVV